MKLAILDRIGTFQPEGEDAIVALQDWMPQPGVLDAIAQLNRGGWHVTLATNQPGLGRGNFDVHELNALHLRMQRSLASVGARVEAIFFCPHSPDDGCTCRKPAPGLLQQIATRYGAQAHEVWVIAQDVKHLQAGDAMGANLVWLQPSPAAGTEDIAQDVRHYTSWQALADALAPNTPALAAQAEAF